MQGYREEFRKRFSEGVREAAIEERERERGLAYMDRAAAYDAASDSVSS